MGYFENWPINSLLVRFPKNQFYAHLKLLQCFQNMILSENRSIEIREITKEIQSFEIKKVNFKEPWTRPYCLMWPVFSLTFSP